MDYDDEISIRYETGTMEDANAFFDAVAGGDYDKMVSLLDEGKANVNQTDSDGFSALMIAASECQEKIVEELIKRDCSVNSSTSRLPFSTNLFNHRTFSLRVVCGRINF